MQVLLEKVLAPEDVARVKGLILSEVFTDGKETSTLMGKNNLQLPVETLASRTASELVVGCLRKHETFNLAVQPQFILSPMFSKYDAGMEYPDHVDNAMMDGHRSDVSMTVFLNEPETYEGGELVIDTGNGERRYRLAAGDAIAYPSSTLHRVACVTRGTRLAAVLWVQSRVRDPAKREILYDLGSTMRSVSLMEGPYGDRLRQSYWNLIRLWADA
jgi:PKHD-type hydroxylase